VLGDVLGDALGAALGASVTGGGIGGSDGAGGDGGDEGTGGADGGRIGGSLGDVVGAAVVGAAVVGVAVVGVAVVGDEVGGAHTNPTTKATLSNGSLTSCGMTAVFGCGAIMSSCRLTRASCESCSRGVPEPSKRATPRNAGPMNADTPAGTGSTARSVVGEPRPSSMLNTSAPEVYTKR
jgi:hypothetical protein